MLSILILHGPNMNLLGKREPDIYGHMTLVEIDRGLVTLGQELGLKVKTFQSNSEGGLIDALQQAADWANGVVFNPGGYTHTSVALRDTIAAIGIPVIEVHLTNILAREEFRRTSIIGPVCRGSVSGFGWRSYGLALRAIAEILNDTIQAAKEKSPQEQ